MKKISLFLLMVVFASFVCAGKVVSLPDISRPETITLDNERIYITENATVFIYSLKDFTLQKKFGSEGEGPREFKLHPRLRLKISVLPDYLLVESIGKLSYFTKEGDYQREMVTTSILGGFKPLTDGFAGFGITAQDRVQYITIDLYDAAAKKLKEVTRIKSPFQPGKYIDPITITRLPLLYTCDNKIFIDGENGKINVFDREGKKSAVIGGDYEKVEVTKARKDRYEKFFLSDMRFKAVYERDRSRVKFPETFPAIRHYHIADKKVYVLTYREKGNDKEFFIFDLNGKLLKHTFLPVQEMNALDIYPYTTKNGKLYQLVDNVETETWELHINEIK